MKTWYTYLLAIVCLIYPLEISAAGFEYEASLIGNVSTGQFAPYMIGSWNHGRITGANGIWHDGRIEKKMTLDKRFNWGIGAEYIVGYGSGVEYGRYDSNTDSWSSTLYRQPSARIQQLYGEIKYRGVFLLAGMKEQHSKLLYEPLSMGDLTYSNNAAPIPGVSAGFVDFQNIPFTNGWVQICGEIGYGKFFDNKIKSETSNRYITILTQNLYFTYKYCYFQTKPSMPFSVIAGAQCAGVFGGSIDFYERGRIIDKYSVDRGFSLKQMWEMFLPTQGNGEGNVMGNTLGSWDFKARYNFKSGHQLSAYFQWFWEDGSGIAKRNGWDGLWGLRLKFPKNGYINNIVAEYLDFTNQAGPNHWMPSDAPGTNLNTTVGGADNNYNNDFYGPYANQGMAIGTPFILAPLYNTDGYWAFAHCRARGFQIGIDGELSPTLQYNLKVSGQKAWGEGRKPQAYALECYSAGAAIIWQPIPNRLRGLNLKVNVAFDAGALRGNNFGTMLSLIYNGNFSVGKK
ncbi:MAG: hypothetical protein J1F05_00760 [Muribaculaceae bacterium]|nr:hypothetical protein [Muribaculaceae bacterium]